MNLHKNDSSSQRKMVPNDLMQLCRLCLKKNQAKIPIYNEQRTQQIGGVQHKISSCFPSIKLEENDKLPKKICTECSDKLDNFYQFMNDAIKADDQLNSWLGEMELKLEHNNNENIANVTIKEEVIDSDEEPLIEKFKNYNKTRARRAEVSSTSKSKVKRQKVTKPPKKKTVKSSSSSEDDEEKTTHLVPIVQLTEDSGEFPNPFSAELYETLKKLGYKNPFVYPENKTKKKSLKKYESKNNNSLKWQCMICSDIKNDKNELMEHYELHKLETEHMKGTKGLGDYFICPVCLTDFTSLISYERHVELNHGEKQYNCELCNNKSFKNLYSLSLHTHKLHNTNSNKVFKCAACDFEDVELKSLRNHISALHEDNIKYRCEICNKGFSSLSWYQEHKNFHTGAMPFECDICSKSFPYTRYLIAHQKNMHPEKYAKDPISHECDICQKKFAHKKSLVLHLRGHSGESAVLCDMCGKSLSSSEHLKQHLRIHTGYKPHCCSVCGKGFAKKCNLTLHERVHSGEKPHICNVCGKGFSQRSTLVIHGRYHSGERPYQCQICKKGFVAKGLLGVHVKTCIGLPE